MIDVGEFIIKFKYNLSPTVAVSADKKLLINKKYNGSGIDQVIIPNHTQTTKIFIIGKTDDDTIIDNGEIIDSQMVEILGCSHQGIIFNQKKFFHYYQPKMFHNDSADLSTQIVFNFPSYLTFENKSPASFIINNGIESVIF
jgi:hypothetical protein